MLIMILTVAGGAAIPVQDIALQRDSPENEATCRCKIQKTSYRSISRI